MRADRQRVVVAHDDRLDDRLHRDDAGLAAVDDRRRGPRAVGAVVVDGKRAAGEIVDAEFVLARLVDQLAALDREPLDRKLVGAADHRDDEIGRQTDRDADVHLIVDVDARLTAGRRGHEARVHQRKCRQRFDDRADEERQQRELITGLAFEAILFSRAPLPDVGHVDLHHRPRMRRGVFALDHAFGDDLARLHERHGRSWDRLARRSTCECPPEASQRSRARRAPARRYARRPVRRRR